NLRIQNNPGNIKCLPGLLPRINAAANGIFGAISDRQFDPIEDEKAQATVEEHGIAVAPVSQDYLSDDVFNKLESRGPWGIVEEQKSVLVPVFISEEHVTTYKVVVDAIEEGLLDPQNTVIVNFDRHSDMLADYPYPMSNNWLTFLLHRKLIAAQVQFDARQLRLEDFKDNQLFNKDLLISIDIDYFDRLPQAEFIFAINQLLSFIREHSLNIKIITIAYSPDYC
ncbi:MAG: hypothetical protein NT014_07335, partial [Candidatus Omnitrophica bacterium]|nr:hypothetical protein [Candidatus Omnitrophota bacterium]